MAKKKAKNTQTTCVHEVESKFCLICNNTKLNLSKDQQDALTAISSGAGPFFLIGEAGSGKSFIVKVLRAITKKCVVTATTGTAAQLINGRTLHSFAGLYPNAEVIPLRPVDLRVFNCEMLIVDEASMLDEQTMDQLFVRFKYAGKIPKLVFVGDFMQLPPVNGTALYESKYWSSMHVIKLSTQHRQHDPNFISALNSIRKGILSEEAKKLINERQVDELPTDCTHIMAHRGNAELVNIERLASLKGQQYDFEWEIDMAPVMPSQAHKKQDISRARFIEKLSLKEKARVVMLTNEPLGRWVNGSTGTIKTINPEVITVKLDNGNTVDITRCTEELMSGNGTVYATIRQFPMILAWAMTIHRSQGMTMDRVGIDMFGHFAPGQTYVALSRCKTAEGVYIKGRCEKIIVSHKALAIS